MPKIILPYLVKNSIDSLGNKTRRKAGLLVYLTLLRKSKYANHWGYFECPSSLLARTNKRYYGIIQAFIRDGILDYYKRLFQDPNDLFNSLPRKYYNTSQGHCIQYKFLIDTSQGEKVYIRHQMRQRQRWHHLVTNSLVEMGYEPSIKRDSYGLRVYHAAIYDYKEKLQGRGLLKIDARSSHPTILRELLQEKNIIDRNFFEAFNERGFYYNVKQLLNLKDEKQAKKQIMYWLNDDPDKPYLKRLGAVFPEATKFIKSQQLGSSKRLGRLLQRIESRKWIDNLLNNAPVEFALPIHDCVLVKEKDLEIITEYIESHFPEIEFTIKKL